MFSRGFRSLRCLDKKIFARKRCFSKKYFCSSASPDTSSSSNNSPYFQVNNAPYTNNIEFRDTSKEKVFPIYRVLDFDGNLIDNNYKLPMSEKLLLEMYKNMISVELFDFIHYRIHRVGKTSFYMPNNGEEASQVGSGAAWKPQDVLYFQYRELGTFFQRGYTIEEASDTNFSNINGHGLGRQMPVHYGSKKLNCVTVSSTLATQMPHASGTAYALKLENNKLGNSNNNNNNNIDDKACCVCYFGDGAASEGDAHAAFNFSATLESPMIWFCRNNGYAISTPTIDQYRGDGIAARAYSYGMYGSRFDGNDLLATYEISTKSRQLCINESRPIMLEAMTYRGSHHSTSDDSSAYRDSDEQIKWNTQLNPIKRMKNFLYKQLLWDENKDKQLRDELENKINVAWQESEKLPKPHWTNLFSDVYKEITPRLQEQMDYMDKHLQIYKNQDIYKFNQYSPTK